MEGLTRVSKSASLQTVTLVMKTVRQSHHQESEANVVMECVKMENSVTTMLTLNVTCTARGSYAVMEESIKAMKNVNPQALNPVTTIASIAIHKLAAALAGIIHNDQIYFV